jgi:hypothetical protein
MPNTDTRVAVIAAALTAGCSTLGRTMVRACAGAVRRGEEDRRRSNASSARNFASAVSSHMDIAADPIRLMSAPVLVSAITSRNTRESIDSR